MKIIFLAVVCLLMTTSSFAASFASDLSVEINPESPLLIPSSGVAGKTQPLLRPYFGINSLKLKWAGKRNFQALSISITSPADPGFLCLGAAQKDLIELLYSTANVVDCKGNIIQSAINSNGNVIMPPANEASCPLVIESNQTFCIGLDHLVQTNPFATYHIPMTVTAVGLEMDQEGKNASKAIATQDFVVQ